MTPGLPDPRNPQIAVDAEDRIWASVKKSGVETVIVTSEDVGATWGSPMSLSSPDGRLSSAVVASNAGLTLVAGITMTGEIYVYSPGKQD